MGRFTVIDERPLPAFARGRLAAISFRPPTGSIGTIATLASGSSRTSPYVEGVRLPLALSRSGTL